MNEDSTPTRKIMAQGPSSPGSDGRIYGMLMAIAGIGVSIYATMHHLELKATGETDAACNINDALSCDAVAASQYSEAFGIPLGIYGLGYFLAIAVLLLVGFLAKKQAREHLQAYMAMSIIGVLVSVVLGGISFFVLDSLCPTCMAIYAICIVQAGIAFGFRKQWAMELSPKALINGGTTAALVVVTVLVVFVFAQPSLEGTASTPDGDAEGDGIANLSKEVNDIPLSLSAYSGLGEDYRKGGDRAKVVIHEFADFQCPGCAAIGETLDRLHKEYGNRILVVFRNYPLDKDCNSSLRNQIHRAACEAAVMARCAGKYGKFWEMHDKIFDNQASVSNGNLKRWSEDLGIPKAEVDACWSSQDILNKVKDDISLANKLGVNSTPTLFINGQKYLGRRDLASLRSQIDKILTGQ